MESECDIAKQLTKCKRISLCGLIMATIGVIILHPFYLFWLRGIVTTVYLYTALSLISLGVFLSLVALFTAEKIKNDHLTKGHKDLVDNGWVHLGGGLYCRKQDIEDRDAEIARREKYDAYMKEHGSKKPNKS
jgi:protein-S-isoprenylcysteine O-methyltransferase Ste14